MEEHLGLLVGDHIVQGRAIEVDSGALGCEYPLDSLEHVQNIIRRHAAIAIIVAHPEEQFELLFIDDSGEQIHGNDEIEHVHRILLGHVRFFPDALEAEWTEALEHSDHEVLCWEGLFEVLFEESLKMLELYLLFQRCHRTILNRLSQRLDAIRIQLSLKSFNFQVSRESLEARLG